MKKEKLTQAERRAVAKTKAFAKLIAKTLPQVGVKIHKPSYTKAHDRDSEAVRQIEQSYNQLDGDWHDWLEVARKYDGKVPSQDRYDVRHNIMIELDRARARDCEPIPILRAYRIASLTVALYWRERLKREVKVCIYNGVATEPKCASCRHKPKGQRCPYQATRPIQSLDQPTTDSEGYECRLLDTIADDNAIEAIDLDEWLDVRTFLIGAPQRLKGIAKKMKDGELLSGAERKYLSKLRKRKQKSLF